MPRIFWVEEKKMLNYNNTLLPLSEFIHIKEWRDKWKDLGKRCDKDDDWVRRRCTRW